MKIEFTSYEQKFNTVKRIYTSLCGRREFEIDGVNVEDYLFSMLKETDVDDFIGVIENAIDTDHYHFTKRSTQAFIWRVRDDKDYAEIAKYYHISCEKARALFSRAKLGVIKCAKYWNCILAPYDAIIKEKEKELFPDEE